MEELQEANAELNSTIQRFSLELHPLTTSRDGHVSDRGLARQRMQASSIAYKLNALSASVCACHERQLLSSARRTCKQNFNAACLPVCVCAWVCMYVGLHAYVCGLACVRLYVGLRAYASATSLKCCLKRLSLNGWASAMVEEDRGKEKREEDAENRACAC